MDKYEFVKGVERLVDPIEVGTIHFVQGLNKFLPKSLQNLLAKASSKEHPYMGFVIEPYSYYIAYEIKDIEKAKAMIPDGSRLIKTKIFADDEPKYYAIIGCFRTHTSAFWGSRVEFYLIAEDESTGLLSWIIADYSSNTISQDKKHGLKDPDVKQGVINVNYDGVLCVDMKNINGKNSIEFNSDITKGVMKAIDERLWLEGNWSITYGKELNGTAKDVFALIFKPEEVEKALDIPISSLNLRQNTWYPDLIANEPSRIFCFPYAQHFLSDSPGHSTKIKNKVDLDKILTQIDFSKITPISATGIKYLFLLQSILLMLLLIALVSLCSLTS